MMLDTFTTQDRTEIARIRKERARTMTKRGKSVDEIAEYLGIGARTVQGFIQDMVETGPKPLPVRAEAAGFTTACGAFCRPCSRRVLPSEARSCAHQCAMKRMAGG